MSQLEERAKTQLEEEKEHKARVVELLEKLCKLKAKQNKGDIKHRRDNLKTTLVQIAIPIIALYLGIADINHDNAIVMMATELLTKLTWGAL